MPASIYKCRAGEAEIQALYDEALDGLGLGYESLTVGTRSGDTHVLAVGPEDAPPTRISHSSRFSLAYLCGRRSPCR